MNFLKSISKSIKSQHVNTRIDPNLVPPKPSRRSTCFSTVGFFRKLTAGVSLWCFLRTSPEPRKPDSGGFFGRFPAKKGDFAETDSGGTSWTVWAGFEDGPKWWVGWMDYFFHRSSEQFFVGSLNFQCFYIFLGDIPRLVFGFKSLVR